MKCNQLIKFLLNLTVGFTKIYFIKILSNLAAAWNWDIHQRDSGYIPLERLYFVFWVLIKLFKYVQKFAQRNCKSLFWKLLRITFTTIKNKEIAVFKIADAKLRWILFKWLSLAKIVYYLFDLLFFYWPSQKPFCKRFTAET